VVGRCWAAFLRRVEGDWLGGEINRLIDRLDRRGHGISLRQGATYMEAAKWRRIVNISSSSARTGAIGMAHYSTSKGAMVTLTRSLAQELGRLGITVTTSRPAR
jgi:NAD(P)-dependent dehydrogenase (short-subunit alcohol dehydrogenase family)